MNPTLSELRSELSTLRMTMAIDSAMLLSILRRMQPQELSSTTREFLEVIEGLNIQALYSDVDENALQAAQRRRDWWIGLIAEVVAENAVSPDKSVPPSPSAS